MHMHADACDDSRHDGDSAKAQGFGGPDKYGKLLGKLSFKWNATWETSF